MKIIGGLYIVLFMTSMLTFWVKSLDDNELPVIVIQFTKIKTYKGDMFDIIQSC